MFKVLFWLGLIGGSVLVAAQTIPVYYNNMKIENAFQGISQKLVQKSEADIRSRILRLLNVQSVNLEVLPDTFFENLTIKKENGKFTLSSEYHVTVWVLGKPKDIEVDERYEEEQDISLIEKIKYSARIDFDFLPFAKTP
ncbi:MAG TPA: DUF4845 domain-containing protein [Ghiorsea sp.]|nr:DUF4845 domain-containing protein [Ghiorsea sp.]HIP06705.1 DUF4845 domain-containing protein [Mariprofundaceae bacterium]